MAEPIRMLECRYNLFPAKFCLHGRIYEIQAVNECKTIAGNQEDGATYHFWVRCGGRQLHLSELLSSGDWRLHDD